MGIYRSRLHREQGLPVTADRGCPAQLQQAEVWTQPETLRNRYRTVCHSDFVRRHDLLVHARLAIGSLQLLLSYSYCTNMMDGPRWASQGSEVTLGAELGMRHAELEATDACHEPETSSVLAPSS